MNAIAQKIRELRIKAKLTEKQLAKTCGLAESYIQQIESGKKVVNETTAEKILAALGEKIDFGFEDQEVASAAPLKSPTPLKSDAKKPNTPAPEYVEPQNQWADALTNIIRTFPIYTLETNQVVGKKELPILSKKVEGYGLDKIQFIQVTQNDMAAYRLQKGDVVLVELTKDQPQQGLCVIEVKGIKMIRFIKREPGNTYTLSRGVKGEDLPSVSAKDILIIGRCIRAEWMLTQK